MKFLHAADLHLDSPLRGLSRYEGAPVQRLRSATRVALARLVDLALAQRVDAVIFAGDLYDADWQDFRTGLYFREQMVRLRAQQIRVLIVQGNHDAQGVISRSLQLPDNVTVLSARKVESVRWRGNDGMDIAVHGRSFPDRAVQEDFAATYPQAVPGCLNIGVLHTSLTGRAGHDTYAPTDLNTLIHKGYDYWALGHVHNREVVCEQPRIVFPGNLQGRHALETGAKGCELVTVQADRDGLSAQAVSCAVGWLDAEFVALDEVRWHRLHLDVSAVADLSALSAELRDALTQAADSAPDRLHAVRIELSGASALHAIEARQPGSLLAHAQAAAQDVRWPVWIESLHASLTAPVDPTAWRDRDDALGELLRLAGALAESPQREAWLRSAIGDAWQALPPELLGDALTSFWQQPQVQQDLLSQAQATVLARLSGDLGAAFALGDTADQERNR